MVCYRFDCPDHSVPVFIEHLALEKYLKVRAAPDYCDCFWNEFLHVPQIEKLIEKHDKGFLIARDLNMPFYFRPYSPQIRYERKERAGRVLKNFFFGMPVYFKTGIRFMIEDLVWFQETVPFDVFPHRPFYREFVCEVLLLSFAFLDDLFQSCRNSYFPVAAHTPSYIVYAFLH